MRIGIDARMAGPEQSGIGRYVAEMIWHVAKRETNHEFVLFVRKEGKGLFSSLPKSWTLIEVDIPWYSLAEQVRLSRLIRAARIDLMHFPHWNVPLFLRTPFVLTMHDLTMFRYPRLEASTHGPMVYALKQAAARWIMRSAVRRAKHIITVSDWVKEDVHAVLHTPREKMTTIYQAPFSKPQNISAVQPLLSRYGITRPYVLCVGTAYPHKNLLNLLRAWQEFCEVHTNEYQLVLVGKRTIFYDRLFQSQEMKNSRGVVFTDFVPDNELAVLYQAAALYVFPSKSEGFGLPLLEAMQYGVPIISSNQTSLPEIAGEGALYFDPNSPSDMCRALVQGLTNEDIRLQLKVQGKSELQRYSSETFAKETLRVYEDK